MPLTVNVGLSRKASKDYQSTGVSINLTAELDQALERRAGAPEPTGSGYPRQARASRMPQRYPGNG